RVLRYADPRTAWRDRSAAQVRHRHGQGPAVRGDPPETRRDGGRDQRTGAGTPCGAGACAHLGHLAGRVAGRRNVVELDRLARVLLADPDESPDPLAALFEQALALSAARRLGRGRGFGRRPGLPGVPAPEGW